MDVREYSSRKPLDKNERDWIITNEILDANTKQVINFTVLQLFEDRNQKSYPIIMHDFSHGCYNIHKYYLEKDHRQEYNHEPLRMELFYHAKLDVQQNWKYYRNEFLRRFLPYELQL
jgi:hypothetical protein